jgi:hypothetical protein
LNSESVFATHKRRPWSLGRRLCVQIGDIGLNSSAQSVRGTPDPGEALFAKPLPLMGRYRYYLTFSSENFAPVFIF